MMTLPRFFSLAFLVSLSGCLEPTSGVFPSPAGESKPVVGTDGPAPELHRFDVELPLEPLFNEPAFPQFHAGTIRQTLGFAKTYFIEMGYNGSSYRFATIDAQGDRGPATTLDGITGRFVLFDNSVGVFFRVTDLGTEFIVQPF